MIKHLSKTAFAVITASALLLATSGCKNLPGSPGAQGAAVGGVSGAAVGAMVGGSQNRLLGALLGGALGAGGGYLIGANSDRILGKDHSGAEQATQRAQTMPATAEQARTAATADVNSDGFVTMDELAAVSKAGFSDDEMLARLKATGQVFELTAEQQQYLRNQGVSQNVINQLPSLNRDARTRVLEQQNNSVISKPQ